MFLSVPCQAPGGGMAVLFCRMFHEIGLELRVSFQGKDHSNALNPKAIAWPVATGHYGRLPCHCALAGVPGRARCRAAAGRPESPQSGLSREQRLPALLRAGRPGCPPLWAGSGPSAEAPPRRRRCHPPGEGAAAGGLPRGGGGAAGALRAGSALRGVGLNVRGTPLGLPPPPRC